MKLVWSTEAQSRMLEILDYIAESNPLAAATVARRIEEVTEELLLFPYLGRPGPVEGFRVFCIPRLPYLIAYSAQDDVVEISTVWHGKQNWMPSSHGSS